eukprot:Seg4299.3 transcript_id=Seg4299.3/GoldUCD/mRNA.D3Y31 product="hypothetical protein" protein_id=Seg4299.3/GoldUCD/D3Y31
MAGPNHNDRSDFMRALRDQASRVYIQTIAANEREDRLLHKKLDAIDLEHRAQYLKMKKWIHDAQHNRNKRWKKMQSNLTKYSAEKSKDIPVDSTLKCKDETDKTGGNKTLIERAVKIQSESAIEDKQAKEPLAEINETMKQSYPLEVCEKLELTKRRPSAMLQDRVDYTKSEVAHLKASFAGQKTPPNLRRRKFLPHLEAGANTVIGSGKKARKGRRRRKEATNDIEGKINKMTLGEVTDDNNKLPRISILKSGTPNDKVIDAHITRAVKS